MKDCVVVIPVHNRPYYTAMSLPATLHAAQQCSRIRTVYIVDDGSQPQTTGVLAALNSTQGDLEIQYPTLKSEYAHTSTGALRQTLETLEDGIAYVAKVDNDILVPPEYFYHLLSLLDANPDVGFLGMKESHTFPVYCETDTIEYACHIGGVGIFQVENLHGVPITPWGRFFGFTDTQVNTPAKAAWTSHSTNTNLDKSAWSCSDGYEETGEGRTVSCTKGKQITWVRPPFQGD